MRVWHGYEIDFPKLKDTDMADLQKYTSDLGNALSRELLKFNSQLASMQDDIEDLEAETVQNNSDLEATKTFIENSMKTLQTEGTSIHVNDSADYSCKLEIEGKSEQVQTEQSANLCPNIDSDKWVLSGGAYKENGYIVLPQAGAKAEMVVEWNGQTAEEDGLFKCYWGAHMVTEDAENAKYQVEAFYLNEDKEVITSNGTCVLIGGVDVWKSWWFSYADTTAYGQAIRDAKYIKYRIIYSSSNTVPYKFKDPMISKTSCATYVEFVPDSPSPDYPSEIENVSGDLEVKVLDTNLFMKQGLSTPTSTENFWHSYTNTSPLNSGWCKVDVNNTGTTTVFANQFLKKGTVDKIKPNTDYVIWAEFRNIETDNTGNYCILCGYESGSIWRNNVTITLNDKNKKIIQKVKTKEDLSSAYLDLRNFVSIGAGTYLKLEYRMMVLEDVYTDEELEKITYEEYKEQAVTFPLGEQKLMKAGYLGDNGIHNKRKQVVLDGMETYAIANTDKLRYPIKLNIIDLLNVGNEADNLLCNTFIAESSSEYTTASANKFTFKKANGAKSIWFFIPKSFFTATNSNEIIAEWKAYLAEQYEKGIPVIVEYEIEEETTAYTSTQQTAYNNLQKLKTYRTVTNISNNQNTNMQLTYKKDLQTQFQELETMLLESGV